MNSYECEYDDLESLTSIYKVIEAKNWSQVIEVAKEYPKQVRTWVSRIDKGSGKQRWRLLPIHAAIIFGASDEVMEEIVTAYPKGVECQDDQGMLPIHLGFRNGIRKITLDLLLFAYPQSVYVKDRKGRLPIDLAQASSSPNKDAFVKVLLRGQNYCDIAVLSMKQALEIEDEEKNRLNNQVKNLEEEKALMVAETKMLEEQLKTSALDHKSSVAFLNGTFESMINENEEFEAQIPIQSITKQTLLLKIENFKPIVNSLRKERDLLKRDLKQQKKVSKMACDILEGALHEEKELNVELQKKLVDIGGNSMFKRILFCNDPQALQ